MRIVLISLLSLLFLQHPAFGADKNPAPGSSVLESYLYEPMTIEKLSRLYWALGRLDISKDENIDNFLRINECDIYRDYYNNEFEWAGIRKAGREFIKKNKPTFPLRFEAIQSVRLGEYDFDRNGFNVNEDFKIKGVRRFEIMADDGYDRVCGFKWDIPGYPRGIVVEFSRPLTFDFLPMDPGKARIYVNEKQARLDNAKASELENPNVSLYRDAYLVIKMKFFSYIDDTTLKGSGVTIASLLGNLEGIEVYADKDKKELLYREDYRRKKKPSEAEERLRKEYAERKKKQQLEAEKKAEAAKAATEKSANP